MTLRAELLSDLAGRLVSDAPADRPCRVAVDGLTAAGKSTFARELADAVRVTGRPARHLSTDDFHHVSEVRRRDPDRARGYYRDAFDLATFRAFVLDPLGPGGDRLVRERAHDLASDAVLDEAPTAVGVDEVVVVDGTFLQVPVLDGAWDAVVWLDVTPATAVERAVPRDAHLFGGPDEVRAAYAERYHAACALYVHEVDPVARATYVVDNEDLERPSCTSRATGRGA